MPLIRKSSGILFLLFPHYFFTVFEISTFVYFFLIRDYLDFLESKVIFLNI